MSWTPGWHQGAAQPLNDFYYGRDGNVKAMIEPSGDKFKWMVHPWRPDTRGFEETRERAQAVALAHLALNRV